MKKGEMISLALGAINGGLTTTDSIVTEDEVEAYIPDAMGYVLIVQTRNQIRLDDTRDMCEGFNQVMLLDIQKDAYGVPFAEFAVRPLNMEKNRGIRYVGPLDGSDRYIVQTEGANIAYKFYNDTMDASVVRLRVEGSKLFGPNIPDNVKKLKAIVIPNPQDLSEDDELSMPHGFALDVVDKMVSYFVAERQQPRDYVADQKDINSGNKI